MKTKAEILSPKEERFCQEILRGQSQSDAYRVAYKPQKAKPNSINVAASKLMAIPKIQLRVAVLRAPVIQEIQIERTMWLKKLIHLSNFDVRKMFDKLGNPVPVPELGDAEAAALIGFELGKAEAYYKQTNERAKSPLEEAATALLLEMKAVIEQRQRERALT